MTGNISVLVSWLFAVWWLVLGIREYYLIRYSSGGFARYRRIFPFLLCLSASFVLGLLGYFLLVDDLQLVLLCLKLFAGIWIAWSIVAILSWRTTKQILAIFNKLEKGQLD